MLMDQPPAIYAPPPPVARAAAACQTFDKPCAIKVYDAIRAWCFAARVDGRSPMLWDSVAQRRGCYILNAEGTWDRQPWLRAYSPYVQLAIVAQNEVYATESAGSGMRAVARETVPLPPPLYELPPPSVGSIGRLVIDPEGRWQALPSPSPVGSSGGVVTLLTTDGPLDYLDMPRLGLMMAMTAGRCSYATGWQGKFYADQDFTDGQGGGRPMRGAKPCGNVDGPSR